ncbi:MAG: SprB repeat-containing protein, partial [Phaeodactylibacter sp.]|nr:SprB repeat-containing protein [Phaeodactylibacter sp.]
AWSTGANTEEANNLAPKTHTITVTDANGCTAAASVEITENILPLQVQFDAVQQISCNAGSDGSIQTAIAGGKPPYTIAWSDGDTDSENRNNLAPGQYEVTISDQAGNQASAAITLSAPEALVAEMGRIEPAFSDTSED